jgi:putative sigma-54 modulation protein
MRLSLTGRHVDVTPGLRQLVERRLARLERLLNDSAVSAQVVLTREKRDMRAEVTVHARGDNMLSAISAGGTWTVAVGDAVEKVVQQAAKVKDKWRTRKRNGVVGRRTAAALAPEPRPAVGLAEAPATTAPRRRLARPASAPSAPRVWTVRYAVKPMRVEDAAVRLRDATEPFIVFRQADTEQLAILFARPDGRLALIEPER